MKAIERLFERENLPRFGVPEALVKAYGGDFGVARPSLYANFVASVDGVVALVEGVDLHGLMLSRVSARGHESHLYLRYAL